MIDTSPEKVTRRLHVDEFKVSADSLLSTLKSILHEGNVRRVAIKNEEGHVILEFPLTAGVIGAVIAPQLVAIGAIAALAAHYVLAVERVKEDGEA